MLTARQFLSIWLASAFVFRPVSALDGWAGLPTGDYLLRLDEGSPGLRDRLLGERPVWVNREAVVFDWRDRSRLFTTCAPAPARGRQLSGAAREFVRRRERHMLRGGGIAGDCVPVGFPA